MKNKKIQLWNGIFGKLSLVVLLFCFSLLFGSLVKAANNETISGYTNDNQDHDYPGVISAGTNQVLICYGHSYQPVSSYGILSLAWHGVAMTQITYGDGNGHWVISYLKNPDVGAYNITSSNSARLNAITCIVKENIDLTASPITAFSGFQNEAYQYNMTNIGSDVIAFTTGVTTYSNYSTSGSGWTKINSGWVGSSANSLNYGGSYKTVTTAYDKVVYVPTGFSTNYIELKTILAPPISPTNYVFYVGDNPLYSSFPSIALDKPFMYNICDGFDTNNEYIISYGVGGVEVGRQQLSSSSCTGGGGFDTVFYFDSANITATSTGSSTMAIFSMPYILNQPILDEPLENLTMVAFSNEFVSYISAPDTGFIWLHPRYSINAVDETATTTKIYYTYNYGHSSVVASTTKVCINQLNTCDYVTESSNGNGLFDTYLVVLNELVTGSMTVNLTFQDASSTVLYTSEDFTIYKSVLLPESTVLSLFGQSASQMACTDEEWAEAETSTSWFNFTKLKCNTGVTFFSFINTLNNAFGNIFKSLGNKLLLLFPLDIPTKMLESWNASASVSLNNDLKFLDVTETDGTIKGYIPSQWMSTTTDFEPVIFGQVTMSQGSSLMSGIFDKFKAFTIFFQYALLALGLIAWGKQVYKDMSNNVHKDE